ncbi:putative nucleoporin autopeptidase [Hamiltosporidium tvaerminnensis]|uniref:Putative nucleoporin autopeptidase n=2 Tax=Hamiltosporidium TaxID=1176354 RepID=A0A4Q9LK30_9MICR|nr:hypothetical protein LUQ84_002832 [Hamiltosporidium tvaerminnensis]TBU03460.1 putative nucleoporin autopeptidase [Hamiltosporidium tvaerminnensis]TBU08227.1 putative nucleoporin autopeptidase [Hamiltosporidium magnivora]TBU08524.1 putative nucleoporin autopeptidase [Hamiltosporidium magnivora]TBU13321.1 putative nucleoporin autopeptidase [Hamiltosporidium tvaerminnensis]
MNPQNNSNSIYNTLLFSSTPKKDQRTETSSFGSTPWSQQISQPVSTIKGTKDTPYKKSSVRDTVTHFPIDILHICSMKEYSDKCIEEIRNEDYILGRKQQTSSSFQMPSIQPTFSSSTQTTSSLLPQQNFSSVLQQPAAPSFLSNQNTSSISQPAFNLNKPVSSTQLGSTPSFFSQPTTSQSSFSLTQPSFQTGIATGQPTGINSGISTGFPSNQPLGASSTTSNIFAKPQTTQPFQSSFLQNTTTAPSFTQPSFLQPSATAPSFTQPSFLQNSTTAPSYTQPSFLQSSTSAPNFTQNIPSQPSFGQQNMPQSLFPQNITNQPTQSNISVPSVNYADPYLVSDIRFEKAKRETDINRKKFLEPIFEIEDQMKEEKNEFSVFKDFKDLNNTIYTIPATEGLDLNVVISNLIIVFEKKGRIEYLEGIRAKDCRIENIKNKIFFSGKEVKISDNIGTGLNKRARVYVEGCYPYSRGTGGFIIGKKEEFPLKGVQERYIYGLKSDNFRKFVDYDCEKGIYSYEVAHF